MWRYRETNKIQWLIQWKPMGGWSWKIEVFVVFQYLSQSVATFHWCDVTWRDRRVHRDVATYETWHRTGLPSTKITHSSHESLMLADRTPEVGTRLVHFSPSARRQTEGGQRLRGMPQTQRLPSLRFRFRLLTAMESRDVQQQPSEEVISTHYYNHVSSDWV